jgi:hypothetical protein
VVWPAIRCAQASSGIPLNSSSVNNAAPMLGAALYSGCLDQRSEGTLAAVRMEIAPSRPVAVTEAEASMAPPS